jgi:hypothetical protein
MEFYEIAGVCRVAINYPCMAHRQFSGLWYHWLVIYVKALRYLPPNVFCSPKKEIPLPQP